MYAHTKITLNNLKYFNNKIIRKFVGYYFCVDVCTLIYFIDITNLDVIQYHHYFLKIRFSPSLQNRLNHTTIFVCYGEDHVPYQ